MDKNTLSNYGWIVIAVLVLAVMIALATPFGEYIKAGVESTAQGLFDVQENALNIIEPPIDYDKYMRSIAHRGYNMAAPENTLPAYSMAKEKGFKYVETDVRATSDGVLVLLHDATINRTARNIDGTELTEDIKIADITYEQALQYDFGISHSEKYAGTKIPTLEEFAEFCKENDIAPYVELVDMSSEQLKKTIDIFTANNVENVTYICQHLWMLKNIKVYDETSRIGYVINKIDTSVINNTEDLKTGKNEVFLDVSVTGITPEGLALAKAVNIPVELWTINGSSYIKQLDPYISGVTSDFLHAGKIIYQASIEPEIPNSPDYIVIKELKSSDISYNTVCKKQYPYYSNDTTRASYVDFDIPLETGYIYKFELDSTVDTAQIGIQFIRENSLYEMEYNKGDLEIKDTGWQSSGYEVELELTPQNNYRVVRLNFRADTNNSPVTEGFITKVTISRKPA